MAHSTLAAKWTLSRKMHKAGRHQLSSIQHSVVAHNLVACRTINMQTAHRILKLLSVGRSYKNVLICSLKAFLKKLPK